MSPRDDHDHRDSTSSSSSSSSYQYEKVELPDDHFQPTSKTYHFNKNKLVYYRKISLLVACTVVICGFVWPKFDSRRRSANPNGDSTSTSSSISNHNDDLPTELVALNDNLQGRVWWPGQDGFEIAAKVWRQDLEPPKAVIEVATEQDVQLSMKVLHKLWQEEKIPFRIRSGGHSKAGFSTVAGGIVLSLKNLNKAITMSSTAVTADSNNNKVVAKIEAGARVEDVLDSFLEVADNQREEDLYAGALGQCGNVAEGGWVLGGGVGFMARLLGLGVDNVLEFRLVLANGTLVVCNEQRHPDLFWALRGAGQGNYGVVTSMTYQLHRAPDTQLFQTVQIPVEDTNVGDFLYRLGDLNTDKEFFLVMGGRTDGMVTIYMSWFSLEMDVNNNIDRGNQHFNEEIRPLLPPSAIVADAYTPFLWAESTHELFDQGYGLEVYAAQAWQGFLMPANNTLEIWDTIADLMSRGMESSPDLEHHIELWGGAISDVGVEETAFPHRDAVYNVGVLLVIQEADYDNDANDYDGDDGDDERKMKLRKRFQKQVDNVNSWWPQVAQYLTGSYINYPMNSLRRDEYPRLYWGDHLKRLVDIKQRYDPTNTFVHEQGMPISLQ